MPAPYNVLGGGIKDSTDFASLGQFVGGTVNDFGRLISGPKQRVVISLPKGKAFTTYIVFDCVVNENYNFEAQPSAIPIESGGVVSDHIQTNPPELQLTGIISDTPLGGAQDSNRGVEDLATQGVVSLANAVAGPFGVVAAGLGKLAYNKANKVQSPSKRAFFDLIKLMYGDTSKRPVEPPQRFRITTGLQSFDNMCIRSMSVPRDATTGNALVFNLTLTSLQIVAGETTDFKVAAAAVVADTKKKQAEKEGPAYLDAGKGYDDAFGARK